jgi:hypothetical protein
VHEITEEAIGKNMRTLWFLWVQMLVASFIYIYICHRVGDQIFARFRPALPIIYMKYVFYCAAAGALVLSYYLRISFSRVRRDKSTDRIIKRAAKMGRSPILVKYNAAVVVSLAMAQYAPLLCVVLFFLGGGIKALYVFVVASLITNVVLRPNRKELDRLSLQWVEASHDVSL